MLRIIPAPHIKLNEMRAAAHEYTPPAGERVDTGWAARFRMNRKYIPNIGNRYAILIYILFLFI
jgi:hypothetical protein